MSADNKKTIEELKAARFNLIAAAQTIDKQIQALETEQEDDKAARRAMGAAAAKAHSIKAYSRKGKAA